MLPDVDPPSCIPAMVEQSRSGSDIVFGVAKQRGQEPLLYRCGVKIFYGFCNRIIGLQIPENTTHFRVLSRQAVNAVTRIKDRMRYLRTLSIYVGFQSHRFEYIPIQRRRIPRRKSFGEAATLALNLVVANSLRPLRIVTWLGLTACALHLVYITYLLIHLLRPAETTPVWIIPSLQCAGAFLVLFAMFSVLCQYVGRLLNETTDRPLYYVLSEHTASAFPDQMTRNVVESSEDG